MKNFVGKFALLASILPFVAYSAGTGNNDPTSTNYVPEEIPKSNIEIGWDGVRGAVGYEVEFKDRKGVAQTFQTKVNTLVHEFDCGRYVFKARSYDQKNIAGSWSLAKSVDVPLKEAKRIIPENGKKILAKLEKDKLVQVSFKWQSLGAGVHYKFEVFDEKNKRLFTKEILTTVITLNLPVAARYIWHLTSMKTGCEPGISAHEDATFDIIGKLAPPRIQQKGYDITWTKPKFAKTFDYTLERETPDPKTGEKKWKTVLSAKDKKDTKYTITRNLSLGTYRISVAAKAPYRTTSQPATYIFVYSRNKTFDRRIELLGAYVLIYRHYTTSSDDLNAKLDNFIFNTFLVSGTAYYKDYGFYLSYERGNRQISFPNELSGQDVYLNLRYSRFAGGPIYDFLIGHYGMSVRASLASEQLSGFELTSSGLAGTSVNTTSLGIEGGPKFRIDTIQLYTYLSGDFLLSSAPFNISQYEQYGAGIWSERDWNDYLSSGLFYRYNYLVYKYTDDTQTRFLNTVHNHQLGLFLKYTLH